MVLLAHALALLAILGGIMLAYAAAFLYENEERQVADRLAAWWVSLEDLSGGVIPKGRALLRKAFDMADRQLDRLLGPQLFSWQALATP